MDRKRKTRKRLETLLLLLCALGCVSTGYVLCFTPRSNSHSSFASSRSSLGEIRPVGKDIRLRGDGDPTWSQVARDANVYRNDRVFTGQNSRAKITLSNAQQLTVEPNSLVIINDSQDKKIVDFSTGGFLANVKKGVKLYVRFQGKETEISSPEDATISLSSLSSGSQISGSNENDTASSQTLNLVVLSGSAEVKREGTSEAVSLGPNSELEVSQSGSRPRESNITLLRPQPGENLWTENPRVEFEWSQSEKGAAVIELSRSPDFADVIQTRTEQNQRANFDLNEPGTYFWRIRQLGHESERSIVSSFNLEHLIPPRLASSRTVILNGKNTGDASEITIDWTDELASESYQVQIASDSAFNHIEKSMATSKTSILASDIAVGSHFVRVDSMTPGRKNLTSNVQVLVLSKIEPSPKNPTEQISPVAAPSPTPTPTPSPIVQESSSIPVAVVTPPPAKTPSQLILPSKIEVQKPSERSSERAAAVRDLESEPPSSDAIPPKPSPIANAAGSEANPRTPWQFSLPHFWIWAGVGADYQYYEQAIPSIQGTARYQNIQGPVLSAKVGFQGERWGFDGTYRDTPGLMTSKGSTVVTNGAYHWKTLESEVLYRIEPGLNLRAGIQYHSMPFMAFNQYSQILDVKSNSLTMATLGFEKTFSLAPRLRGEWLMRYQYPLMSGTDDGSPFTIHAKNAFDGSIGGVYSLSEHTRLGAFWYGQFHQYSFDYGRGLDQFSGNQTLFYSSVEFKLGFEF